MGGYWQGSTAANQTAFFDNVFVKVQSTSADYWAPQAGGGGSGAWTTTGTTWASSAGTQGTSTQGTGTLVFGNAAGTVTVSDTVSVAAGMQLATTGYLFSGGTISLTGATSGSNTITVDTAVTGTIDSVLAGSAGMTKAGAGTLALGGASTLTGTVAVNAGTLATTTSNAVADAAIVNVSSGAVLQLGGNETVAAVLGSGTVNVQAHTLTADVAATGTFSGVIAGTGGLTKTGAGTYTLSGNNAYSGATTVSAGTLATSSAERIGNSSAVSVGTGAVLHLGGAETVGSLAGSGTVSIGANAFTAGGAGSTTTFDGVIQGTGGTFTKAGAGGLTFTAANTYTGATTISGGTLALSGGGAVASTFISVSSGAAFDVAAATGGYSLGNGKTLAGVGTVVGAMTLGNGSTIAPGATLGAVGTLAAGDLVLSGGATYAFDLANATTGAGIGWDLLDASGANVTLPGLPFNVVITGPATGFTTTTTQSWKFLAASALSGAFDANNFAISTVSFPSLGGGTLSITNSGTAGTGLYVLYTPAANQLWLSGTGGSGTWTATGGTSWNGGAWQESMLGTFEGTAGTVTVETVTVGKGLAFSTDGYLLTGGTLTFTGTSPAANPVTVTTGSATIASTMAGANGLQKLGVGTLALGGGGNTLTGTIDVEAGTLATTASGAIADGADVLLASGASLALGAAETVGSLSGSGTVVLGAHTLTTGANGATTTFAGLVEGTGGLTKSGTGTFTLSAANTYSGATTVDRGVLATSAAERIADGSALVVNAAGTLSLGGAETIGSLAGSGSVALGSHSLTVGSDSTTTSFTGVIAGTGGLTKAGAGTLALGGANTYSGTTTVSGGTLATSVADVIADTSAVTVNSGATLALGAAETLGSLVGAGTVDTGGFVLTVGSLGASGTFTGLITGGGSVMKTGTGLFGLSGTTAVGSLAVTAGQLVIGATSALPTAAAVSVSDSGRLRLGVSGTFGGAGQTITLSSTQSSSAVLDNFSSTTATLVSDVNLAAASTNQVNAYTSGSFTLAGNLTGSGLLIKQGAGNLILAGTANTHSGATEVAAGTLTVAVGSALGSGDLRMNVAAASTATLALEESESVGNLSSGYVGSGNNQITIASGKTLTVNQTASGTFGASSGGQTSTITGAGGFTKAGVATLTLAGGNSFTGPTTVSGGELVTAAANAISGSVTVASGATLALGGIQTFTALSGAGTLAAGSSAMTFNLASDSTFAGTLTGNSSSSLTKTGAGTMNFSGVTSGYAGTVTVNQGTITGLSFGSGTVAVNAGSALGEAGGTIASNFTIGSPAGFGPATTLQGWDFTGQPGTAATLAATTVAPGLDGDNLLTRGAGAAGSSGTNSFRTTGFQNNGIGTANIDYFQWTVVSSSAAMQLTSIDSRFNGTASFYNQGVGVTYQYAYSTNGTTFTMIGSPATTGTTITTSYGTSLSGVAPLSNIAPGTTVTFRYYASGSTTTGGWGFNSPGSGTNGLQLSGAFTTPASGSGTLGIAEVGSTSYTGSIAVNTTATLTAVAGGTATFSGAISGTLGAITKTGLGVVALSGSSTYAGATTVSQGTLTVLADGRLAGTSAASVAAGARLRALGEIGTPGSNTPVTVNGILSGNGRLFGTVGGSGSIDPGNSPGIVTLTSIDPSAGLDHNFEFTATAPVYTTSGTGALNDVVHVTGAAPFTAALSGSTGNTVNVFFNAGSFTQGTTFVGGFFVDQAASLASFITDVGGADFNFFVADAGGGTSYEGVNYLSLAAWNAANGRNLSVDVGGLLVLNALFGTGAVSGYVTTFAVVPEPTTLALAALGLAAAWAARRRPREHVS